MSGTGSEKKFLNMVFVIFLIVLVGGIAMLLIKELGDLSEKGWILIIVGIVGAGGIFAYKKYS